MGIYKTMKVYGSNCFIYEFDPSVERFDTTIGIPHKLEKMSKMIGEPKPGEVATVKLNGGFFHMNGASEYIGAYVDDGLYYNPSSQMYPTLVYGKDNILRIELNPNQQRLAHYQANCNFAIGVPWTLIVDGKIDYTFPVATIVKAFGHPHTKAARSLVGQKANKNIVLVAVDGRKSSSPGYTMETSAQLMKDLGCVIAVNVDGGGSTELIVDNKIKNKPSDGCERSIGTMFLAYKKAAEHTIIPDGKPKAGTTAVVTAIALNMRSGPSTSYGVIEKLSKGTLVNIIAHVNGWYNIKCDGKIGYCSGDYLQSAPTPVAPTNLPPIIKEPTVSTGITNSVIGINVRNGPGPNNKIVGTMENGRPMTIYETKSGWYRIGTNQWVCAEYVKKT